MHEVTFYLNFDVDPSIAEFIEDGIIHIGGLSRGTTHKLSLEDYLTVERFESLSPTVITLRGEQQDQHTEVWGPITHPKMTGFSVSWDEETHEICIYIPNFTTEGIYTWTKNSQTWTGSGKVFGTTFSDILHILFRIVVEVDQPSVSQ